jgi:hypothetical protein
VVSTTVLLLPEFLPDLVEDDAVVFSFNDPSGRRSYTTSADATRRCVNSSDSSMSCDMILGRVNLNRSRHP